MGNCFASFSDAGAMLMALLFSRDWIDRFDGLESWAVIECMKCRSSIAYLDVSKVTFVPAGDRK